MISKFKYKLKSIVEKLPYQLGCFVPLIPNNLFFGKKYSDHKKNISIVNSLDDQSKKKYIYKRVKRIVDYAYKYIEFYKKHYESHSFTPDDISSFKDIKKIPIIRKEDLQEFSLEKRSNIKEGGVKINTGGTTGEPLEFYIEPDAFAREWSHMLHIWSGLGYLRTDLKLTFRGKNIGDTALRYNPVNNEYLVNTYWDIGEVSYAISELLKKRNIKYIHGYPSAIYEFAKYIDNEKRLIKKKLNKTLKGIFLGSEFPAPTYRNLINQVFDVPDVSWYGHSERCILAYEKREKWKYEPMLSYGFCEAVPNDLGDYSLVGTSYYNLSSPFIRYKTGDLISPNIRNDLLQSFGISKGRIGEFIKDHNGQNISLTSLIFGRHHEIFGKVKFIQVGQEEEGKATIYVTPFSSGSITEEEISSKFDSSNVDVDFSYEVIEAPFKTSSGKISLLVNN